MWDSQKPNDGSLEASNGLGCSTDNIARKKRGTIQKLKDRWAVVLQVKLQTERVNLPPEVGAVGIGTEATGRGCRGRTLAGAGRGRGGGGRGRGGRGRGGKGEGRRGAGGPGSDSLLHLGSVYQSSAEVGLFSPMCVLYGLQDLRLI